MVMVRVIAEFTCKHAAQDKTLPWSIVQEVIAMIRVAVYGGE